MSKAVALASSSDLSILVLGEAQNMSGEAASRKSLDLPGQEEQLLQAVVATGKPVVLVLLNGRPLNITWAAEHVPAILEAWYPGTQGGNAIADLLFGDAVPGGKLPIAWPRDVGQIPINYAHNTTQAPENQAKRYWDEQSTPLYPFGYGLSYSTFGYSNLKLSRTQIKPGETVEVSFNVENTGATTADEVAQLYIHQQSGSASRPVRELKGFQRITLQPHVKTTVRMALSRDELAYWSTANKSWVTESATFDVWVGGNSNASLHANFIVSLHGIDPGHSQLK
jgi:beta-glucosidase